MLPPATQPWRLPNAAILVGLGEEESLLIRVLPRSLLYRGLAVKTGLLGESPRLKTSSGTDSIRAGIVTFLRDSEHQRTLFLFEKPARSAARWLVPKRKC